MGGESLAAEVLFCQPLRLLHGAGGAVEDQDALFERLCQGMLHRFAIRGLNQRELQISLVEVERNRSCDAAT